MISLTRVSRARPSEPPGWRLAKSRAVKWLRGFSGERHGNADVPVLDDAQIPVQGVQGIQQNGGRSRRVQGSDDFGPDVAGFAYAYNDDLVAAVQSLGHEVHSLVEIVVQPGQDAAQFFNLHFKNGFGAC